VTRLEIKIVVKLRATRIPRAAIQKIFIMSDNPSHFKPGIAANPGGRPKGAKNLKPKKAYDALVEIYLSNLPKLKTELEGLSGKDFVSEMRGIVDFIVPKQQRIVSANFNIDAGNEERIEEIFVIGGRELRFTQ
jgi:hypothetical protein